MKNLSRFSIIFLSIILLTWFLIGTESAMARGFLDFFWSILTDFGGWVKTTLIGGTIKNTLEFLASFVNQKMIKPDYWGALYGSSPPQMFRSNGGEIYTCSSPDPTRWYRESINSRWIMEPKAGKFVELCFQGMFGMS